MSALYGYQPAVFNWREQRPHLQWQLRGHPCKESPQGTAGGVDRICLECWLLEWCPGPPGCPLSQQHLHDPCWGVPVGVSGAPTVRWYVQVLSWGEPVSVTLFGSKTFVDMIMSR